MKLLVVRSHRLYFEIFYSTLIAAINMTLKIQPNEIWNLTYYNMVQNRFIGIYIPVFMDYCIDIFLEIYINYICIIMKEWSLNWL